jgi:hypothetical protein
MNLKNQPEHNKTPEALSKNPTQKESNDKRKNEVDKTTQKLGELIQVMQDHPNTQKKYSKKIQNIRARFKAITEMKTTDFDDTLGELDAMLNPAKHKIDTTKLDVTGGENPKEINTEKLDVTGGENPKKINTEKLDVTDGETISSVQTSTDPSKKGFIDF